ncbi:PaaX family transcriptional regulator C-terminal domain-containing protein [Nonomuraea sp. NPDC047897]|uniref:PaaX family transcriptional regulator n=1 Tax=Nonomuraea sp. NPDC047897 TaxID=3364346 RepID=UPI00371C9C1D
MAVEEGAEATPRSLVFDLFGEYVRANGGYLTLQALSRLVAPFGVQPDSLRVLMSRLRRNGWFETIRVGRTSFYLPSALGWQLLDEGYTRIMSGPHDEWSGDWYMVIFSVPETERTARARIRKQLVWLGFGQLAPSTWVSPHDRLSEATDLLRGEPCTQFDRMITRSLTPEEDRAIAGRCWDLVLIAKGYLDYIERWTRTLSEVRAAPPAPDRAFVLRTQVIHEYRKFLFADPDLPARLLPDEWPGHPAWRVMRSVFATLREPATQHYKALTADMPHPGGEVSVPEAPPLPAPRYGAVSP